MAKGKYKKRRMNRMRRETKICGSGISTRTAHCLEKAGIATLKDLDEYPYEKFIQIPGIGEASMKEIAEYRMMDISEEGTHT